jgi:hypothetical protein
LKLKPDGKAGEIEYPFVLMDPPEFVELTVFIAFPRVMFCTELERAI